ncbi:MATE family efflux transporter [Porcipelethomonas sp.]|uniref:MATE family efflux transporter n=1 Tax=Porcipelethomonas sp. TaxID=2981675 RepID=UPI003EFB2E6A
MKEINLLEAPIRKTFFHYLVPSVLATMVTSIYILADTIMIGNKIGADALAGLNIIFPLIMIFFGTGNLLGIGGSVLMSVAFGRNDKSEGKAYFTGSVTAGAVLSVLYIAILSLFFHPIMNFLGSSDITFEYIKSYMLPVIPGIPFFIFSSMLQAFVRNDQSPKIAMAGSVCGGILNIILDIIFMYILEWGMFGAAFASIIGLIFNMGVVCIHFFTKKNSLSLYFRELNIQIYKKIFITGFPVFITDIASGALIYIFNIRLLKYFGETGVAIYGIISNTSMTVVSVINGISQAAQPVIAVNLGAQKMNRINAVCRLGVTVSFITGLLFTIMGMIFPEQISGIFINLSEDIVPAAVTAVRVYFIAFCIMGINIFMQNYFQSTLRSVKALMICLFRGFIISSVLVFILPIINPSAIWAAVPAAEFITLLIFIFPTVINKYKNRSA